MAKSYLNIAGLPLGLRNNNPGNLRAGINWQGLIGENRGFCVFENLGYGIRALAIDLRTKIRNGYDTIELILFRFAPPSENDTLAYIGACCGYVSNFTGIRQNQPLQADPATLQTLCRAIINFEIGQAYDSYVTDEDISQGIAMMDGGGINTGVVGFSVASGLLLVAIGLLLTMPKKSRPRPAFG